MGSGHHRLRLPLAWIILVAAVLFPFLQDNVASKTVSVISEETVASVLDEHENKGKTVYHQSAWAEWNYYLDINDGNEQIMAEAQMNQSLFDAEGAGVAQTFKPFDRFANDTIKRRLEMIAKIGLNFTQTQAKEFNDNITAMSKIYSTAYICNISNPNCYSKPGSEQDQWVFDPTLITLMAESRDYDLLTYIWKSWREETGVKELPYYESYVTLGNKGAVRGGYTNMGEWWRAAYEDPSFEAQLERLWSQVLPFYEELHAYIRRKLRLIYPNRFNTTAIPAHILGNMWAQEWTPLFRDTAPYPDLPSIDVTDNMRRLGYTPKKMFETAQSFFNSIGLFNMTPQFWENSMLEKPKDRLVDCWPTAEEFYNGKDYAIKMCTVVNMDNLVTIHHEMGHVEYYMSYSELPVEFHEGANPGFHEAVGDTIALSVITPSHLQKIGLLDHSGDVDASKQHLNFLYNMALSKTAFLPFGYLMDLYRWNLFNGSVPQEKWNQEWWNLRYKYQGLVPPVPRSPKDFDAGAKYHVPNAVPYIRYFVAGIIQFQFQKALCAVARYAGPLSECDIYQSKDAGALLKKMLSMGSSKPWQEAMQMIANTSEMSAQPMLDYFQPLLQWLHEQNEQAGDCYGWGYQWPTSYNLPTPRCGNFIVPPTDFGKFLQQYNAEGQQIYYDFVNAKWTYWQDETPTNQKELVRYSGKKSAFDIEQSKMARYYSTESIKNATLRREMETIGAVGLALNSTDMQTFHELVAEMNSIYSKVYICDPKHPRCHTAVGEEQYRWPFDPTLDEKMATATDYDLLAYIWEQWRAETGVLELPYYRRYVELGNRGARNAGYKDMGEWWRSAYEDPQFETQLENLWVQILPFYEELFAYMRHFLKTRYPDRFNTTAIPAHILGSMWAHSWTNLFNATAPYKDLPSVDVTNEMKSQGYTPKKMFLTAESFYDSIGLFNMPPSFWNRSIFYKPVGRPFDCWPDAEDFFNGNDYGIKMCAVVDMSDLITIHREMGHIEYFMSYSAQPLPFKKGANPGFHEAIGDTIALAVSTPGHLHKIGLLKDYDPAKPDERQRLNFLYKTALSKVAFLPFSYLVDLYRWKLFAGSVQHDQWNSEWWNLRYKFQGLVPPDKRTNAEFDAGAMYHVPNDVGYIRYFVAGIIQFQFFKALCDKAGHKGPLSDCDFYQNKEAGKLLKDMLQLGMSRPWQEAMQVITNTREMSADPMLEYFKPLYDWLRAENKKNGECYGWGYEWPASYGLSTPRCKTMIEGSGAYVAVPTVSMVFTLIGAFIHFIW